MNMTINFKTIDMNTVINLKTVHVNMTVNMAIINVIKNFEHTVELRWSIRILE